MRALVLLALLAIAPLARGAEYHVTTTGSGSACTLGAPCATIAAGLAVAGPNDVLWIHAGTYVEAINSDATTITGGSSWATRLIIAEWPGDTVVLRPAGGLEVVNLDSGTASYVEISGLALDGVNVSNTVVKLTWIGVETNSSNHIRIRRCEIYNGFNGVLVSGVHATFNEFVSNHVHHNTRGGHGHGFYISSSDNLLYDNEVDHHDESYGIHVYLGGSGTGVDRNRVLFNRTHHNGLGPTGGGGILISSGEDNEVRGNRNWSNDSGITIYGGDPPGHLNPAVDTIVADNYNWDNIHGAILVAAEATGTIETNNSTTQPGPAMSIKSGAARGASW